MLTLWGEGRGFRIAWLLEELGLPYRLRPVDLLAGVDKDPDFLAINPAGYIPALQDGETIIVESIAIMDYLLSRHGPTPLKPTTDSPVFAAYLQFLHLGEAGLAGPLMAPVVSRILAPEDQRDNWGARWGLATFESRLRLVRRQLAAAPYMAGGHFTAADISITYALQLSERTIGYALGEAEHAYLDRTTAREAYARAMDMCVATKAWVASLAETKEASRTPTT